MNLVEPIRSKDDIEAMCDYLQEWNYRNYMLFYIGINTGLRISDIISLRVGHIKGWYIVVTEKKTKKYRKIKMSADVKRKVDAYIKDKTKNEYLFQSRKGKNKPITRQTAYYILRTAAEDCGIENIGTHSLRKSFGYHYYQKYKDVAMLMELFNHESPKTTKIYIGINQDMHDRNMANFHLGV